MNPLNCMCGEPPHKESTVSGHGESFQGLGCWTCGVKVLDYDHKKVLETWNKLMLPHQPNSRQAV
jgi:hypothetical protein